MTGSSDDQPLWAAYDALILDLDGVVYAGSRAIDHASSVLRALKDASAPVWFATNNASRTAAQISEHLRSLGISADPDQIITSSAAAVAHLAGVVPAGSSVRVIGADGIRALLLGQGYTLLSGDEPASASADIVVQGHSPRTCWTDLASGFADVMAGALWVATNDDLTIPVAGGLAPGNGALVEAIAVASGRRPDIVIGKPHTPMFDYVIARTRAQRPLIIGDSLRTDIAWACRHGCDSLHVGTGVDRLGTAAAVDGVAPTFGSPDLRGLLAPRTPQ